MAEPNQSMLPGLLETYEEEILASWLDYLRNGPGPSSRIKDAELTAQAREIITHLKQALRGQDLLATESADFAALCETLTHISHARAPLSFRASETAAFVLSLKQPLLAKLGAVTSDAATVMRESWLLTQLIDKLALFTTDVFQRSREDVILRQQQELAELSTPVVRLWRGILALPLIGTLDSERTQVVMENLLRSLVEYSAEIAIIDITGVPTVDTQVAQHLLKTVAAARLMGADCIISGIRPQIAQTMVHLGVELSVVSKATLADAFAIALSRLGRAVVSTKART